MHQKNKEHWRAFDTHFFEKHQRVLLWFLNTPVIKHWARWIFGIEGCNPIKRIAPNYLQYDAPRGQIKSEIREHDKYSKQIYNAFKPIWWTMHYIDEFFLDVYIPKWSFGFSTLEFRPQPDPETVTVDGYIYNGNSSWDTCHDESTGQLANDSSSTISVTVQFAGSIFNIQRGIMQFDTSSIGVGATITEADIDIWPVSIANDDNDGDDFTCILSSNPASNTSLSTADFDQVGDAINNPTELSGRIDLGSSTTGLYNTYSLNSNGIAAISKDGISKFGIREGHDILDNPISNSGSNENTLTFFSADQTGAANDPKLTVTYTPAVKTGGLVKLASNF